MANVQSDTVSRINGRVGKVTATIPARPPPFGVAVDPRTRTIYVTDSDQDGQVAVIRTRSRTVVAKVPVGRLPLLVAVNPKTNTIYATNQEDATVSISGTTDTVTKMISVGFDPQGVAVNPRTNRIYVANLSGNTVSVISGRTNRVTATIPVGTRPDDVAVNPRTNTIYAAVGTCRALPRTRVRHRPCRPTSQWLDDVAVACQPRRESRRVRSARSTATLMSRWRVPSRGRLSTTSCWSLRPSWPA